MIHSYANTAVLRSSALAVALSIAASVAAQFTVTGKLIDPSGEPSPSALYHIYLANDTVHPVVNNVTDIEGVFTQPLSSPGEYLFRAEYGGTTLASLPFSLSQRQKSVDLGEIVLGSNAGELAEVTVIARKPLVVSDGANLQYNVAEDPTAQTNTVLEMLRKVPMVTVDGEDNIRVNGQSDFRIYLNGKPNPMFDSDPQRVLKAMPASAIQRIEVLTEPGAKYDAEGVGGILNIVTAVGGSEQMADGYQAVLSAGASVQNLTGSAYIRGKYKRVSGSVSLTYADSHLTSRSSSGVNTTEYFDGTEPALRVEHTRMPNHNEFSFWQANLSLLWEPNTRNLFTVSGNLTDVSGSQKQYSRYEDFNAEGILTGTSFRYLDGRLKMPSLTIDATYQHLLPGDDHNLTAGFQYSMNRQDFDIYQKEYTDEESEPDAPMLFNGLPAHNNEYTLQVDYHNRFSPKHLLEVGAKGVLTDNRSDTETYLILPDGSQNSLSSDDVNMKQYRNIGAVYGAYTGTYDKWTVIGGLRFEYTDMGVKFHSAERPDYHSNLYDLVPNAAISYSLTPKSTLRLAYNMRISRPTLSQLNPYQVELQGDIVKCGNPDLDSQRSNNASIAYTAFGGGFSFQVKAEYQHINNLISQFSELRDGVIYESYRNTGIKQSGIFSAFINWNITPKMMLGVNGSAEYCHFDVASMDLTRHGWTGNFGANYSYTMPLDIQLSAYGGLSTKRIHLQGTYSGWHYYGLGVSRSFLEDKALKISLTAGNFFDRHFKWESSTLTKAYSQHTSMKMKTWSVGISLQYTFGNLKARLKTLDSKINNDDAVKTDNGQQGGGIM